MLLGGGNNAPGCSIAWNATLRRLEAHQNPDAPVGLGNKPDQGILVADPAGDTFVAWAGRVPNGGSSIEVELLDTSSAGLRRWLLPIAGTRHSQSGAPEP